MGDDQGSSKRGRHYPPFWERAVPIVIGIIAAIIVLLLIVVFAVILGVFPLPTA